MNNTIEITGLSKSFKNFEYRDVSLTLPTGYIMGFIGPNGSGKTTTIKLILNMLKRDSGSIKIFGKDNLSDETQIKERIGVVMDSPFYVDDWTLIDLEKALSPFYKKWDTDKYRQLLSEFTLNPKKKIKELSRGMKMKLMIAAALSHDADLLILDEPTSGLDAVARNDLMDILGQYITNEKKSILFSTHITSDLEKIADYITYISNGRIIYSDTKDNLMEQYILVKGGCGVLSTEQKKQVFGYREHGVGFDGLIRSSDMRLMPKSLVAEPCTLDEIIVRLNMEGKGHE
ncbi:MAG: ABC transporter ATP-binding protein [Eubacteriales bacterium]